MDATSKRYIRNEHLTWALLVLASAATGISAFLVNPWLIGLAVLGIVNIILMAKYPSWGLVVYLVVFLLRPGEMYHSLAPLRIELLCGVFVIVSIILHQMIIKRTVAIPKDRITLAIFAILVTMGLSVLSSYDMRLTYEQCIIFLKLIIFHFIIISVLTSRSRFVLFNVVFIIMIGYLALDSFRLYMSGGFVHTMNVDRLTGSTSAAEDPNALGATLVTAIPIVIATGLYFRHILLRLAMFGLSGGIVVLMALTASRSALISFLAICFAALAFTRRKALNFILLCFFLIGGWFMLPEQYQQRYAKFTEVTEDINEVSSGRWEIWQAGLNMFIERPILGVGAGAYAPAYFSGSFGHPRWMQSHSLYIELLATMGMIGFGIFAVFIGLFLKRLYWLAGLKLPDSMNWVRIYSKAFIIVVIGLLISGLFGHNLYRYTWYMVAGLTVCLTAIIRTTDPETEPQ